MFFKNIFNNQKGIIQLIPLAILVVGVIAGIFLIKNPQILQSRAGFEPIVVQDSSGNALPKNNGVPYTHDLHLKIVLTSTLGSPKSPTNPSTSPSMTPTPPPLRLSAPVSTSGVGTYNSSCVNIIPPPQVANAGQKYSIRVQMKNTGRTAWTQNQNIRLGLISPQDSSVWGVTRAYFTGTINSGSIATFDFTVTAPQTPGYYNFEWKMLRELYFWFGGVCAPTYQIYVVKATTNPTAAPTSSLHYTVSYKLAENKSDLDTNTAASYSTEPTVIDYTLKNTSVGQHFIWVRFTDSTGKKEDRSIEVDIVNPTPTPTPTMIPLSPPPLNQPQSAKILILKYFPLNPNDPTKLDSSITLQPDSLSHMRSWVDQEDTTAVGLLTTATKYHGYRDSNVIAGINYQISDTKEFLKPLPRRFWTGIGATLYYADYQKILTEDVNVCDYVDKQNVKDIWIWGYQTNVGTNGVGIFESNMSMGRVSKAFWNLGSFGDVSNDHYRLNDLPQCDRTYVVYTHNYRGYNGATNVLHVYGHQMENEMKFADTDTFINGYTTRTNQTYNDANSIKGCGDVHSPPNTPMGSEYGYYSTNGIASDCESWRPGNTGQASLVDCHNWFGKRASCIDDGGRAYYLWWYQNMPGIKNGIVYAGKKMRNWWEFMADFDTALLRGKILLLDSSYISCPDRSIAPSGLSPADKTTIDCSKNTVTLTWNPVPNATYYNVRVSDGVDSTRTYIGPSLAPGASLCSNPSDVCIDHYSSNSLTIPISPGRTYAWWLQAGAPGCGDTIESSHPSFSVTASCQIPPTPTPLSTLTPTAAPTSSCNIHFYNQNYTLGSSCGTNMYNAISYLCTNSYTRVLPNPYNTLSCKTEDDWKTLAEQDCQRTYCRLFTPSPTPTPIATRSGVDGTWCNDSKSQVGTAGGSCQDQNGVHNNYCDSNLAKVYYCNGDWTGVWKNVRCDLGGYGCSTNSQKCSQGACVPL